MDRRRSRRLASKSVEFPPLREVRKRKRKKNLSKYKRRDPNEYDRFRSEIEAAVIARDRRKSRSYDEGRYVIRGDVVSRVAKSDCLPRVKPIYYKNEGLVTNPYSINDLGEIMYDSVRAFVVMEFPYTYMSGPLTGKETIVKQTFYRSSGSNSSSTFGIDNINALGTWIPTNAVVVNLAAESGSDGRINTYCESSFIMKKPFIDITNMEKNNIPITLLSRFHDDPQLAFISYLMGGGIWNYDNVIQIFGNILEENGFKNLTLEYPPGCLNIKTNVLEANNVEINLYIGDAVSWNWHPSDLDFLSKSGVDRVDLKDDLYWIDIDERHFIPGNIFFNPLIIRNYLNPSSTLKKYFTPEKIKANIYGTLINSYKRCKWVNPIEFDIIR